MSLKAYIEEFHSNIITNPFPDITLNTPINVEKCTENLITASSVCKKHGLSHLLVFGTLLGAYRDDSLIPYDTDVDIAFKTSDEDTLVKCIEELIILGFKVARYANSVNLLSLSKDNDYIDFYGFSIHGDMLKCYIFMLSNKDFNEPTIINFKGTEFTTVNNIEQYLESTYGSNWRTPIKGKHAG